MWQAIAALAAQGAGTGAAWWLGNQQGKNDFKSAMEAERRQQIERDYVLGEARAKAAASGFEYDSQGIQTYITSMEAEFARQHQWAVDQAKKARKLNKIGNALGVLTGAGSAVMQYGQSNNWWQSANGQTAVSGGGTEG